MNFVTAVQSPQRFLVGFLAAILGVTGCTSPPTRVPDDPDATKSFLRSCPSGDRPWREVMSRGTSPADLTTFETIAREVADARPDRWEPRWALAEALFRQSKAKESEAFFLEAHRIADALHDDAGVACTSNRLGSLARLRGESALARTRFGEALEASRRARRRDLEAFVQNNLAAVRKDAGELGASADALDSAIALLEREGLVQPAREARYNRGVLLRQMGDLRGARSALEHSHEEATAGGDRRVASLSSVVLGNLLLSIGAVDDAERWFERAVDSAPQSVVYRELGRGLVSMERSRFDQAIAQFERASREARLGNLAVDALLAEARRGEALRRAGKHDESRRVLAAVVEEAAASESRVYALWMALWQLGRAEEAAGRIELAIDTLSRAIDSIESQGLSFGSRAEGLHFLLERVDPFVDLSAAGLRGGWPVDRLLAVHARAHARALRRSVDASSQRAHTVPTVTAIRSKLREGEAHVDYLIGRDRGVAIVVTKSAAKGYVIPGIDSVRDAIIRWRVALERPLRGGAAARLDPMRDIEADLEAGKRLTAAWIRPLEPLLRSCRRLTVVTDREMAVIPLAALPEARASGHGEIEFLIDRFEFAYLPFGAAPAAVVVDAGPIVLAGDPVPDQANEFPSLPGSRVELDGIEAVWPGREVVRIREEELTRDRVHDALRSGSAIVHLSTHAVASTNDPRQCALVVSKGERLGFDRIASGAIDSSLVVLSSCRSGEGEVIPGQGIVGLSWAFLSAGARGLVVSLWTVDDRSTSELMIEFHRRLRDGRDVADALAGAQRMIRAGHEHPAWWAPFVSYSQPVR